jgi:hypothetical protein
MLCSRSSQYGISLVAGLLTHMSAVTGTEFFFDTNLLPVLKKDRIETGTSGSMVSSGM